MLKAYIISVSLKCKEKEIYRYSDKVLKEEPQSKVISFQTFDEAVNILCGYLPCVYRGKELFKPHDRYLTTKSPYGDFKICERDFRAEDLKLYISYSEIKLMFDELLKYDADTVIKYFKERL